MYSSKTASLHLCCLPHIKLRLDMALQTPWPTCVTCQAIPPAYFHNEAIDGPHHLWATFSAFANSASRGCHTCTLLYEAVREPFKHLLDEEPVYLERSSIDGGGTQALALTIDPASLLNRDTWDEFLKKTIDDQPPNFRFQTIADIKYVLDAKDVPRGAQHFKGKL